MTAEFSGAARSDVSLEPQRVVKWATFGAIVTLGAGYLQQVPNLFFRTPEQTSWFDLFNLDTEASLSAWYASVLLFCVALLMMWSAAVERNQAIRTAGGWRILGWGFIYLSVDELISIHERLGTITHYLPDFSGIFHFKWLFIGLPIVLIVGIVFLPFLLRLPRRTAVRLFLAGTVFLSGAVGMEVINGLILSDQGFGRLYLLAMMLEETLEIVGLVLAIRCVGLHLADALGGPALRIARTA